MKEEWEERDEDLLEWGVTFKNEREQEGKRGWTESNDVGLK